MKKLLTVTCLAGLLSIPSVVFADEAVPEEVMSDEVMADEVMAEEAMPEEPEISPEMQGHLGDSHSGAVWYGFIRAGVSSSGGDVGAADFGSRWGIRGSSQIAEGLTAVYNYEQSIDSTNATQGGRLSYVGLSGGFGSITMGQIWSASYNSVGAMLDKSYLVGPGTLTSTRIGNAISYAASIAGANLQIDAVMDPGKPNSIDQVEFGFSADIGDIAKVAFAHVREPGYDYTVPVIKENFLVTLEKLPGKDGLNGKIGDVTVPFVTTAGKWDDKETDNLALELLKKDIVIIEDSYTTEQKATIDGKEVKKDFTVTMRTVYGKDKEQLNDNSVAKFSEVAGKWYHNSCLEIKAEEPTIVTCKEPVFAKQYYYNKHEFNDATLANLVLEDYIVVNADSVAAKGTYKTDVENTQLEVALDEFKEINITKLPDTVTDSPQTKLDKQSSHVAVEATMGGIRGYLGWSEVKEGDSTTARKTHFGASGSLGENGLSYLVQGAKTDSNTPWGISLAKSLGGGATVVFEHGNDGSDGTTAAFLQVDF